MGGEWLLGHFKVYLGGMFSRFTLALFFVVSLAHVSFATEESQEELYYQALKAEEAGDIARALKLFESAVEEGGPYTAEIQEIINEYQDALSVSPWEFHTYGKAGYVGLLYWSRGISGPEFGSELATSATASVEYTSKNWNHALEFNLSGGWFVDKDDLRSLDTSAWETDFGLEYGLTGKYFALDVSANLNVSEVEDWNPEFYLWLEGYLARFGKQKVGLSLWGYDYLDGPLYAAAYASWHRFVQYGWRSSVYMGARFEADSVSVPYWLKWVGPSFNQTLSFKFKSGLVIDAKLNLFYGYIVDGPESKYEKIQKFSSSWICNVSWMPGVFGVYVGAEQFYRRFFNVPRKYRLFTEPKKTYFTEFKGGVKWDI